MCVLAVKVAFFIFGQRVLIDEVIFSQNRDEVEGFVGTPAKTVIQHADGDAGTVNPYIVYLRNVDQFKLLKRGTVVESIRSKRRHCSLHTLWKRRFRPKSSHSFDAGNKWKRAHLCKLRFCCCNAHGIEPA